MIVFSKTHIPDSLSLCEEKKKVKMKESNENDEWKKTAEKLFRGIFWLFPPPPAPAPMCTMASEYFRPASEM